MKIAIVELDLENDDPQIKDVFARVNRTSNSLTTIEKLTSEYASTEYMFAARLLSGDIEFPGAADEEADWRADPNTPQELYVWAKKWNSSNVFSDEFIRIGVFTEREISRMVHVMYVLNIISTIIAGFFNRNEKTMEFLNDYSQSFPKKDWVVDVFTSLGTTLKRINCTISRRSCTTMSNSARRSGRGLAGDAKGRYGTIAHWSNCWTTECRGRCTAGWQ